MPRLVDHEARRAEIIDATWRLIEEGGFQAATMREIAARAGFANGATKRYFDGKGALLAAAYQRAFTLADERAEEALRGLTGIAAIRAFCLELMPLDERRRTGARVVLAFWDAAAADPELAAIHRAATRQWIARLEDLVAEGRRSGEIRTPAPDEAIVDELVCLTMGLQVVPTLLAHRYDVRRQVALLDAVCEGLARPGGPATG